MSDSPSWLTSDNETAGAAATDSASAPAPSSAPTTTTPTDTLASNNSTTTTTAEDEKDLPGIILTMRLANMGVAAALMTVSIMTMIGFNGLTTLILGIYATCGGLLICCLETQLKFLRVLIAVNFGFLFNSLWRFLFYIVLGSVAWSYENIFGRGVAIAMATVAVFNTYVLCRYPGYRKIREKIAEEEDKRIEARISKEVKRQAVNQLTK